MKKINISLSVLFIAIMVFIMNVHLFSQENNVIASKLNAGLKDNPVEFKVYQNFPNPFYNSTTIKFDIASQSDAKLTIYDSNGNEVKCYLYNNIKPGTYQVNIDASYFNTGDYNYIFQSENYTQTYTMRVVK